VERATPTGLHLYVPNADQVYRNALEAGAESLHAPVDQPYGDREASVKDLAGNHWYIATHQTGGHVPAGLGTVTACSRSWAPWLSSPTASRET
jgi:hypothetical protein